MNEISTSGPIQEQFILPTDMSTTYETLVSRGYNQLVKMKRQGRWFLLKGLQPEYRGQTAYLDLLKKEYELRFILFGGCFQCLARRCYRSWLVGFNGGSLR